MQIVDKNSHALNDSGHETDSLFMHDSQEFLVQQIYKLYGVDLLHVLDIHALNLKNIRHYIHYLQHLK